MVGPRRVGAGALHGRPHTAVGVFLDDVPALRAHFAGADVWALVDGFAQPAPDELPPDVTRLFTELRKLDPSHAWLERA